MLPESGVFTHRELSSARAACLCGLARPGAPLPAGQGHVRDTAAAARKLGKPAGWCLSAHLDTPDWQTPPTLSLKGEALEVTVPEAACFVLSDLFPRPYSMKLTVLS